jgi:pimeloyl-ACP methyl ester carboxylesterase
VRLSPLIVAALTLFPSVLAGQTRSLAQDSTLDNLRHPPGTVTAADGTLGRVRVAGSGPRTMLLIPGIGFGDGVWDEFIERHRNDYTMIAITLPGFGGTAPLAMPDSGVRYAQTPWTRSMLRAIEHLLDSAGVRRVTVVAHWALATQIALRLALDHPDRVEAVVLVGGVLKSYYENTPGMRDWTRDQRARVADGLAQRWFRTVTRRTWDDQNFMAYDYAVNPRRGLFLWREAAAPSLAVWIRYLLEFYAVDVSAELRDLRVPTLVVQPGFDDPAFYVEEGRNYMRNLCLDSWRGAAALSDRLRFVTIPGSRLFVMHDQPAALDSAITGFLRESR